ncbi:MAG: hypothetical protein LBQ12_14490 [Deltaproteobacteria bacterium]|nr:hypothetical protein [Deltaproteobacteria bacterium]
MSAYVGDPGPGYSAPVQNVGYDPNAGYGFRPDGTPKGLGYFGPMLAPDGNHVTEISVSTTFDGEDVLFPLVVPTLTDQQVKRLVNGDYTDHDTYRRAWDHAMSRRRQGRSVWAEPGEIYPLPPAFQPPEPSPVQWLTGDYRKSYDDAYRRYDPYPLLGERATSPSLE